METIKIEEVQNGWILYYYDTYTNDDGREGLREKKIVFSYDDGEENKLEKLRELLWQVNDFIGVLPSKHNEKNLNIEVL